MEKWKRVKGFPNYEVSNTGKVRNERGALLHAYHNSNGYLRVQLFSGGEGKRVFIHRLVAEHFIDNPRGVACVNHIDNDCTNNNVDNLEWCTHKENMMWSQIQGRAIWSKNRKKSVVGENIKTGELIHFDSVRATQKAGFIPACVCACCQNDRTHKGYRWRYA